MAKQVKLKAEPRPDVGRSAVRKLRARGFIPAVIYGGNDKPQPLQVSARDINAMMSQASGENVLVELEIGGDGQSRTALVQEVQHSPVRGEIRHVDFHAISMDQMESKVQKVSQMKQPSATAKRPSAVREKLRFVIAFYAITSALIEI